MGADGEGGGEEGGAEEAREREREREEGVGVLWIWGEFELGRLDEREIEAGTFWEGQFFFGCEGLVVFRVKEGERKGGKAEVFV